MNTLQNIYFARAHCVSSYYPHTSLLCVASAVARGGWQHHHHRKQPTTCTQQQQQHSTRHHSNKHTHRSSAYQSLFLLTHSLTQNSSSSNRAWSITLATLSTKHRGRTVSGVNSTHKPAAAAAADEGHCKHSVTACEQQRGRESQAREQAVLSACTHTLPCPTHGQHSQQHSSPTDCSRHTAVGAVSVAPTGPHTLAASHALKRQRLLTNNSPCTRQQQQHHHKHLQQEQHKQQHSSSNPSKCTHKRTKHAHKRTHPSHPTRLGSSSSTYGLSGTCPTQLHPPHTQQRHQQRHQSKHQQHQPKQPKQQQSKQQ